MAMEKDGKVYRNLPEQVEKNKEDIEDLRTRIPYEDQFYTRDESDARYPKMSERLEDNSVSYIRRDDDGNPYLGVNFRNQEKAMTYYAIDSITTQLKDDDNEITIHQTPGEFVVTKNDVSFDLLRNGVQHDMLISITDDDLHDGQIHLVFYDNYADSYDYAKIKSDFRGNIFPSTYGRNINSSTLSNNLTRVYVVFYLDDDDLMVQEKMEYYNGSQLYEEETVGTYKVMACNDKIIKL